MGVVAVSRSHELPEGGKVYKVSLLADSLFPVAVWSVVDILQSLPAALQEVGNRSLLLLRRHGVTYCIDAHCHHMGRSLAEGEVTDVEDAPAIVCPWHGRKVASCKCQNTSVRSVQQSVAYTYRLPFTHRLCLAWSLADWSCHWLSVGRQRLYTAAPADA